MAERPALVPVSNRIWTIPNLLSALRLAGVPLFLYWVLHTHQDGRAILLLMAAGASDYFDGKIARRYGQSSRLGQLLDPAADRLYILATLVGLAWREIIPIWLVVLLVGRDVLMSIPLAVLKRHGYGALPVHFLGKAATANLLYAFPLLLLGDGHGVVASLARVFGWAFAIWGTGLYWWAGLLYAWQVRKLLSEHNDRAPALDGR